MTSVRSVDELLRAGQQVEYLYFWGHRPGPGGVGPGCLSQWWPAEFVVGGLRYATAEHFMMSEKAMLFGDADIAGQIRRAPEPADAKALGRQIRGFDEQVWARHRCEIVIEGNLAKFGQHPQLRDYLRATGDAVLVEASPVDTVWGIGLAADDERAARPQTWHGLNLLGFALMEVRARLG
ncbi:NADAR family protein [Amycolatopsis sp.]|uniref:NADAR family protein n=1 Tax=Amycolatopsis sp. TaxID=37632 RepID=UPI002C767AB0|nr:NADAR family protein [Amycolatopsis sp.]HVV12830.1 NADAR family protein [Amycolatopsis sp.]